MTGVLLATIQLASLLLPSDAAASADDPWWSLTPLVAPRVPVVTGAVRTPIDSFLLARLEVEGIDPSPEPDRRTLLRRVTFDLHGLPPTGEELDAFERDPRPDAYEQVVERLLASPRYGERWGRHWLDVVHFGETHGYDKDKLRENAWPYRDWVIRAFNEDKPYARFVCEQLAGDVLYPGTSDGIIALGFIAAGPWDFVGHVELRDGTVDKAITRSLDRDDMLDTAMSSFVSTTAACARCHDHKFDPIPQEDYYRLQAVFAGVERADRPYEESPRDRHLTSNTGTLGYHSAISAMQELGKWVQVDLGTERVIDEVIVYPAHEKFAGHPGPAFGFPLRYRVDVSSDELFLDDVVAIEDRSWGNVVPPRDGPIVISAAGISARYVRVTSTRMFERSADWVFALGELVVLADGENIAAGAPVTALDSIEAGGRWGAAYLTDGAAHRFGKSVYAAAASFAGEGNFAPAPAPRPIHRLRRGDVRQPGDLVSAGALACVPSLSHHFELTAEAGEGARRAALARWITDPANPLTWRSIVNRVWQHHFGRGLVDTPNDFGRMGQRPTHPELLDWLAVYFLEEGGSIKQLHRLILSSAAYRRSSAPRPPEDAASRFDADNRWLWRMPRRRLEAEAIRDSVLAVSGALDLTMGGPSVRWFGFVDDHSPHYDYAAFDPDGDGGARRSVYRHVVRSVPDPFFEALDCADASALTPKRHSTLTPLQALALLNDRFILRQSERFAARIRSLAGSLEGQVDVAVRLALSRAPTAPEAESMAAYARRHGLPNLCRLIFNLNEFVFID